MKSFGKFAAFLVFLTLMGASEAFAQKLQITGTAPATGNPAVDGYIANDWGVFLDEVNAEFGNIDKKPEDLIKAFATSSVYASQGAAQRGYGEPKLFTFTVGSMAGVKTGSKLSGIKDCFTDIGGKITDNGDLTLGVNVQALSGQFTLNTSRWLVDGLDLGIRFGGFKLNSIENIDFSSLSFGVTANYQIVKAKKLIPVVFTWRGVSLGTGFIWQNTKMRYAIAFDRISTSIGGGNHLTVDPKLVLDMKINTFVIPLEATTAIQLFSFLNIPLGVGADIAFGEADMRLGIDGDVNVEGVQTPGSLNADAGGKMAPDVFNFKIMTGLGFKIGPVILDVPIVLYPGKNTGASVGVTLGFTL